MATPCLVVGGCGFLGKHVVRQLLESGKWDVTVFDLRLVDPISGAKYQQGDITKLEQVKEACFGKSVVFHLATAAPSVQNATARQVMWAVNVLGTENVIQACIDQDVPKLVYVSSTSVHFEGKDLINITEDQPYSSRKLDAYTDTKIKGESLVLAAGSRAGSKLATCALRPSYIYGEGDALYLPSCARRGVKGKMRYIIGDGKNLVEFTYVGNIAHGVVIAGQKLEPKGPLDGQAVFVTDQDPQPFWSHTGRLLSELGFPDSLLPQRPLPVWLIYVIATVIELFIAPILRFVDPKATVDLSRFRILTVSSTRTCNHNKARNVLGYYPKYSVDVAVKQTVASFPHLRYQALQQYSGEKRD